MRNSLTIADVCVLALLIFVSAASILYAKTALPGGDDAVVEVGGKEVIRLSLDTDSVRKVSGEKGYVVLEVREGKARVSEASCPNKVCVDQGWISHGAIVCLPNRILVRVGLRDPGDRQLDAITR